jgi:ABC-type branched-subunit amino acid transport system substrate-binding protein
MESESVTSAASAKPAPIVIMQIYDGTGPAATPEVTQGATAALKAINHNGGVDGHRLVLLTCNTFNDPNTAAKCGQTAVSKHVIALVGSSTQYATEFLPSMVSNQIADFGAIPAGVGDFTSPASYPIIGGPPVTISALPYFLAKSGYTKIAIVRPDLAAASIATVLGNEVLKPFGVKIAADVAVPVTAPDLSPYIASATGSGINANAQILPGQQAVQFVEQVKAQNPSTKIALEATNIDTALKALGSKAKGLIEASDFVPLSVSSPTNSAYKNQMRAAGFRDLGGFREDAWLAVRTFANVLHRSPELTASSVYTSLGQISGLRTGVTPPLQWVHGGVGGFPRLFNACEMQTVLTSTGVAKAVNGTFYNPFTNAACPGP